MNVYLKALGVLLVTYSITAGMLIPLGPGVLEVEPRTANGGEELAMTLLTYNSNLAADKDNFQARIRLNSKDAICAKKIEINDNQKMTLFFDIPSGKLPIQTIGENGKKSYFPLLEMHGKNNGYSSLESAIFIKENTEESSSNFCELTDYPGLEKTSFPFLNILEETIRNLFYHVPMWFAMLLILFMSVVSSVRYLMNQQEEQHDIRASSLAAVGLVLGLAGIVTGALWAKNTWGAYWSFDVKQNMSAVALLIYAAYFVLRSSFDDIDKRARVSAIYNIFAFATLIPLLYIIPRMVDSLHPGMGGNPAFSKLDLDSTMRMVFYPSILGWILIALWIADLATRIERLKRIKSEI